MSKIISALIFVLVGLIFLFIGYMFYFKIRAYLKKGIKTTGIITDKEKTKNDSDIDGFSLQYFRYEVSYKDSDGKIHTKVSESETTVNKAIGAQIEVLYDKNKPEDFIIFAFLTRIFSIIFITTGFSLIIYGILMSVKYYL